MNGMRKIATRELRQLLRFLAKGEQSSSIGSILERIAFILNNDDTNIYQYCFLFMQNSILFSHLMNTHDLKDICNVIQILKYSSKGKFFNYDQEFSNERLFSQLISLQLSNNLPIDAKHDLIEIANNIITKTKSISPNFINIETLHTIFAIDASLPITPLLFRILMKMKAINNDQKIMFYNRAALEINYCTELNIEWPMKLIIQLTNNGFTGYNLVSLHHLIQIAIDSNSELLLSLSFQLMKCISIPNNYFQLLFDSVGNENNDISCSAIEALVRHHTEWEKIAELRQTVIQSIHVPLESHTLTTKFQALLLLNIVIISYQDYTPKIINALINLIDAGSILHDVINHIFVIFSGIIDGNLEDDPLCEDFMQELSDQYESLLLLSTNEDLSEDLKDKAYVMLSTLNAN